MRCRSYSAPLLMLFHLVIKTKHIIFYFFRLCSIFSDIGFYTTVSARWLLIQQEQKTGGKTDEWSTCDIHICTCIPWIESSYLCWGIVIVNCERVKLLQKVIMKISEFSTTKNNYRQTASVAYQTKGRYMHDRGAEGKRLSSSSIK